METRLNVKLVGRTHVEIEVISSCQTRNKVQHKHKVLYIR
jgi:hypothetical protein